MAVDVEVLGAPDALPAAEVARLARIAMASVGIEDGHLAVEFVDSPRIRELNRAWRGRDATTDVLSALAQSRRPGQTLVGFAAEHGGDPAAHGRVKLERKRVDAIVVNDISNAEIGFEAEQNEVTIVTAAGATCRQSASTFPLMVPSSTVPSAWLSMDIMLGGTREGERGSRRPRRSAPRPPAGPQAAPARPGQASPGPPDPG